MKKLLITLPFLFMVSQTVQAGIFNDCLEKAGSMNNSAVDTCSEEASDAFKKSITKNYRTIYKKMNTSNPDDAKKFEDSQIAWLKYRNNYCALAVSYIAPQMYGFCPMEINRARAQELEEMVGSF